MFCMQTFYLWRCVTDGFVTMRKAVSVKGMCLVSALRVPESEEKCKSGMETLSLFSADPQLFKPETKREDLAHLSLRVNTSTKGNRTEIPLATVTKKGLGGLEVG
jgi:hypothetical protein